MAFGLLTRPPAAVRHPTRRPYRPTHSVQGPQRKTWYPRRGGRRRPIPDWSSPTPRRWTSPSNPQQPLPLPHGGQVVARLPPDGGLPVCPPRLPPATTSGGDHGVGAGSTAETPPAVLYRPCAPPPAGRARRPPSVRSLLLPNPPRTVPPARRPATEPARPAGHRPSRVRPTAVAAAKAGGTAPPQAMPPPRTRPAARQICQWGRGPARASCIPMVYLYTPRQGPWPGVQTSLDHRLGTVLFHTSYATLQPPRGGGVDVQRVRAREGGEGGEGGRGGKGGGGRTAFSLTGAVAARRRRPARTRSTGESRVK